MNIPERVKNILLQPVQEWPVIEKEPGSVSDLYTSYIVPLAAIGPVASFIGFSVFGFRVPFGAMVRIPFGSAIGYDVVSYILSLAGVYLLGLVINASAPTFQGVKNAAQALKLAAYSSTAAWVAGVFSLIPMLSFLQILGFYSLYLLYLGLPVLMKSPQEKTLGYAVTVVIAAIVIFSLIGAIGRAVAF